MGKVRKRAMLFGVPCSQEVQLALLVGIVMIGSLIIAYLQTQPPFRI